MDEEHIVVRPKLGTQSYTKNKNPTNDTASIQIPKRHTSVNKKKSTVEVPDADMRQIIEENEKSAFASIKHQKTNEEDQEITKKNTDNNYSWLVITMSIVVIILIIAIIWLVLKENEKRKVGTNIMKRIVQPGMVHYKPAQINTEDNAPPEETPIDINDRADIELSKQQDKRLRTYKLKDPDDPGTATGDIPITSKEELQHIIEQSKQKKSDPNIGDKRQLTTIEEIDESEDNTQKVQKTIDTASNDHIQSMMSHNTIKDDSLTRELMAAIDSAV